MAAAKEKWGDAFAKITGLPFFDQAVWWLNGFWEEGAQGYAEDIWNQAHLIIEIDTGAKILYGKRRVEQKQNCDLDEMKAHVFLEKCGETLTVRALRKRLSELDVDNNKRMALIEYLLAKHNKTPLQVVNADQGSGVPPHEMQAAQQRLADLQDRFNTLFSASEAAQAAREQAKQDKAAADDAAAQAKQDELAAKKAADNAAVAQKQAEDKAAAAAEAEAELMKLEAELQVAVDAVLAEEKKIQDKVDSLQAIINGPAGGVQKNKAVNELAQLKGEDPLPLRKAKITQQAALKRAEKARQPASLARSAAEFEAREAAKAREAADSAAHQAVEARKNAEIAAHQAAESLAEAERLEADLRRQVKECQVAVAEAEAVLQEMKSRKGTPHGKIWWMERTLAENQKYMPK
jgi:chromosome segregation ATPase